MQIATLNGQEGENDPAREISKEHPLISRKTQGCAGFWKVGDENVSGSEEKPT